MGLLPPRVRDWKRGVPQIGVFLRTAEGSTMQMVRDRATEDEKAFVMAMIRGLTFLPDGVVRAVRLEMEARIAAAERARSKPAKATRRARSNDR